MVWRQNYHSRLFTLLRIHPSIVTSSANSFFPLFAAALSSVSLRGKEVGRLSPPFLSRRATLPDWPGRVPLFLLGLLGLELNVDLPGLAERFLFPVGCNSALDLSVLDLEIAHLDVPDGAEAFLLVVGMSDDAADNFSLVVDSNNEGAAEVAETSLDVRFLFLGMVLLSESDDDGRLIRERLTFPCRDVSQLRFFAVAFEHARYWFIVRS